ncbi:OmpA family protein [Aeromonas sp. 2HA2]|uniref:flagellar motor protein MotB n=1 Tax=unclassified Aeromonas TaxID=257493 RepID=UPI0023DE1837|nr:MULTISPECIES: flagellar motor protein MotB [unclassified Aeromonas]ELI6431950.1 OmpA family protein [Aeromonas salmonicida subsp. salmonicida]MDF2400557.1 OmpA family protein [Aeromonas sp. 5HA1]MDF2408071.1 OmpA family protein [Aeromonas sp. 2HA2]
MRKRYRLHLQGREHLDRWLVSYADYMTLIFALFVVLYSVALVNKDKYRAVIDGMTQAFSVMPPLSDGLLEGQGTSLLNGEVSATSAVLESARQDSPSIAPISGVPIKQDGTTLATIDTQLQENMGSLVEAGVVKLTLDDNWLTIELSSGLLFGSGSAFMSTNAEPVLNTLSSILKPVDNYVRVRGYTDNQQINNEIFRSNWTLSAARAEAVLTALIAKGVAPQRLAYEAYGEFSPFTGNDSEQGRLQNRKVVVAISKFAWVPPAPAPVKPVTVEPVPAVQQAVEAGEVKVITLPGGGIRITTRQD